MADLDVADVDSTVTRRTRVFLRVIPVCCSLQLCAKRWWVVGMVVFVSTLQDFKPAHSEGQLRCDAESDKGSSPETRYVAFFKISRQKAA
jgi:hypothetical protein